MTTALGGSAGTGEGAGGASGGAGNPAGGEGAGAAGGAGSGAGGEGNKSIAGSGGGDAGKTWRDTLPEDIRNHATITSFKDIESLTKSFIHAQSVIGKKGAIPPQDWAKATPEEKSAFYKGIGMPEADKYELSTPKDVTFPKEVTDWFKQQALENGLLPHQANSLLENFAKFDMGRATADAQAKVQAQKVEVDALKKDWGDAYSDKANQAAYAAKKIGGEDFVKFLDKSGLGNDVRLIKVFHEASKLFSEDSLREGGVGSGRSSASEMEGQIKEIMANGNTNGYFDAKHPAHNVMVDKVASLRKQITGGR